MPRLESAGDRRREQHWHALGLPFIPRSDEAAGVFEASVARRLLLCTRIPGEPVGIPVKIFRDQPAYALSRSAMTIFRIFIMACMARSAFLRSGSLR